MKKFAWALMFAATVLLVISCTTQMKPRSGETSPPSSSSTSSSSSSSPASASAASAIPSAAQGEVGTITGTVGKMHFVKGFGFSHVDLAIEITTEDGRVEELFASKASTLMAPDGKERTIMKSPVKLFKGKQVEIKYALITNAPGGLGKFENGKNGIVSMRVLN